MTESTENKLLTSVAQANDDQQWQGCTLEELRRRRAVALVRRELGREKFAAQLSQVKDNVSTNGVRGLLFSNKTVARLKTADYLLLGWKLASWLISMRNRKRR